MWIFRTVGRIGVLILNWRLKWMWGSVATLIRRGAAASSIFGGSHGVEPFRYGEVIHTSSVGQIDPSFAPRLSALLSKNFNRSCQGVIWVASRLLRCEVTLRLPTRQSRPVRDSASHTYGNHDRHIEPRIVLLHVLRPVFLPKLLDHRFHGFGIGDCRCSVLAPTPRASIRIDGFLG